MARLPLLASSLIALSACAGVGSRTPSATAWAAPDGTYSVKVNIPARGNPLRELDRAEQMLRAKSRSVCSGPYAFSAVRSEAHFGGETEMALRYEATVRCLAH